MSPEWTVFRFIQYLFSQNLTNYLTESQKDVFSSEVGTTSSAESPNESEAAAKWRQPWSKSSFFKFFKHPIFPLQVMLYIICFAFMGQLDLTGSAYRYDLNWEEL